MLPWWYCCHHMILVLPLSHGHLKTTVSTSEMQWCHQQHHWHEVMLMLSAKSNVTPLNNCLNLINTMVPSTALQASFGADTSTSLVTPKTDCLKLRSIMVPLMSTPVSCDTDASAKQHVTLLCNCLSVRNAMVQQAPQFQCQHQKS